MALVFGAALAPSCDEREYECTSADANLLYAQRIAPVLQDERPRTCNQCHLSGVDLSLFVKDTPCQTMACMVEQEIVNLEDPASSLVLMWIERASPASEGITRDVIDEEYRGFLQWIEHTAECGSAHCPTYDNPCDLEEPDPEDCDDRDIRDEFVAFDDPGGCDDIVLEEMFQHDFYAWRSRCFPCHWSTHGDSVPEAPNWLQIGACDVSSLATLREIERRGYIDVDEPTESLLLLKPLDEELGGIEHGGGTKFHDDEEESYLAFVHFLERYAACNNR